MRNRECRIDMLSTRIATPGEDYIIARSHAENFEDSLIFWMKLYFSYEESGDMVNAERTLGAAENASAGLKSCISWMRQCYERMQTPQRLQIIV